MTFSSLVALGWPRGTSPRPKSFNSIACPLATAEPTEHLFPLSRRLSGGCSDLSSGASPGGDFRPKPALVRPIRFVRIDLGRSVLAANETLKQTENYHARKVKG